MSLCPCHIEENSPFALRKANTNDINNVSCEERSDDAIPCKDEMAAPFGLAMIVTIIILFVLIIGPIQ